MNDGRWTTFPSTGERRMSEPSTDIIVFSIDWNSFPFEAGGAVASMLQSVVDQFREAGG